MKKESKRERVGPFIYEIVSYITLIATGIFTLMLIQKTIIIVNYTLFTVLAVFLCLFNTSNITWLFRLWKWRIHARRRNLAIEKSEKKYKDALNKLAQLDDRARYLERARFYCVEEQIKIITDAGNLKRAGEILDRMDKNRHLFEVALPFEKDIRLMAGLLLFVDEIPELKAFIQLLRSDTNIVQLYRRCRDAGVPIEQISILLPEDDILTPANATTIINELEKTLALYTQRNERAQQVARYKEKVAAAPINSRPANLDELLRVVEGALEDSDHQWRKVTHELDMALQ